MHLLYHRLVLITLTQSSPPAPHKGFASPWPSASLLQKATAANLSLQGKMDKKEQGTIEAQAVANTLLRRHKASSSVKVCAALDNTTHITTLQLLNMYIISPSENTIKE